MTLFAGIVQDFEHVQRNYILEKAFGKTSLDG